MPYPQHITSFHRSSDNRTFDSTCRSCFQVIASVKESWRLAPLERTHVCDPVRLYQIQNGVSYGKRSLTVDFKD